MENFVMTEKYGVPSFFYHLVFALLLALIVFMPIMYINQSAFSLLCFVLVYIGILCYYHMLPSYVIVW